MSDEWEDHTHDYSRMNLNGGDIIELPDGRIGTITYHFLNGYGGIWGELEFGEVPQNNDDGWPEPEFILRDPSLQYIFDKYGWEAVGEKFLVIQRVKKE